MLFRSDRYFQLWDYQVSHRWMLVRSPESPRIRHNVDVLFFGVQFMAIPTYFEGLELGKATPEDAASVRRLVGEPDMPKLYYLSSSDGRYFVSALGFKVYENDLDIFESGLATYFWSNDPASVCGTLLASS
jgi:hypothetical protein